MKLKKGFKKFWLSAKNIWWKHRSWFCKIEERWSWEKKIDCHFTHVRAYNTTWIMIDADVKAKAKLLSKSTIHPCFLTHSLSIFHLWCIRGKKKKEEKPNASCLSGKKLLEKQCEYNSRLQIFTHSISSFIHSLTFWVSFLRIHRQCFYFHSSLLLFFISGVVVRNVNNLKM